jgi:hypothetical protein
MAVIAASVSLGGGCSNVWQIRSAQFAHSSSGAPQTAFGQHGSIAVQQLIERREFPMRAAAITCSGLPRIEDLLIPARRAV